MNMDNPTYNQVFLRKTMIIYVDNENTFFCQSQMNGSLKCSVCFQRVLYE